MASPSATKSAEQSFLTGRTIGEIWTRKYQVYLSHRIFSANIAGALALVLQEHLQVFSSRATGEFARALTRCVDVVVLHRKRIDALGQRWRNARRAVQRSRCTVTANHHKEDPNVQVLETKLEVGITRSREFERKRLATHAVNVGVRCGHGCLYCSTGAVLRMHRAFATLGVSPFKSGYAIVDPKTPERVARDAQRLRKRGMIQMCTFVDAWAPEALQHDIGRRCLQAIFAQSGWTIRILTKSSAVQQDFDVLEAHRERVLVGLSLTATPDRVDVISVIEPYAASIAERMAVLREARARGLRMYAMLCPLLPGVADAPEQIDALVQFAAEIGAEEIFAEPVNPRGNALRLTQETLHAAGHVNQAEAVGHIRCRANWSRYVVNLVRNLQRSVRKHHDLGKLRILLYPSGLSAIDASEIRRDTTGVVWLGKEPASAEDHHADR